VKGGGGFMAERINRIAEEMKKEISAIVQNELKDPRLSGLTSIVAVDVTKDLRYAKVYFSVLGSEEDKKNTYEALKKAAGYIRREVGHRMEIRYTPELIFEPDKSIEHGAYISKLIDDTLNQGK
jgi:ribosome-binding factor A